MTTHLSIGEEGLRLALALVAGIIVGWERESRGRPAGLRTTILACVAACLAMIISENLFAAAGSATIGGNWRPDPARLGAGVLTGIGFLGAGTIIRHGSFVRGVTTAASLWFVTVIGLTFGAGEIALGCLGTTLALVVLLLLPILEKNIASDWFGTLTVTAQQGGFDLEQAKQDIVGAGSAVTKVAISLDMERQQTTVAWELKLKRPDRFEIAQNLLARSTKWPGVLRVNWT